MKKLANFALNVKKGSKVARGAQTPEAVDLPCGRWYASRPLSGFSSRSVFGIFASKFDRSEKVVLHFGVNF